MRIPLKFIPLDVQAKYNLKAIQSHDAVVMRIDKSIYGLKQAGIHATNGTAFTLVVDDFLVEYKDAATGQHLIACL